jgi:parallel beta-helix repeat protein
MTRLLGDKTINRRLGVVVITGLAAALTGAGAALGAHGVPISTCHYNITAPGSYALATDLTCGAGVNGINIFASNVTLDLNGHTITGPNNGGGTGVVVSNNVFAPTPQIQNVQVRGPGLIQDFANGLYLQAASNSEISDVVLIRNSFGIVTNFGVNDKFKKNVATHNTTAGFDLRDSNDQIQENVATNNPVGIEVEVGNGNEIFNNRLAGNNVGDFSKGVYIKASDKNHIHNNIVSGNLNAIGDSQGIEIEGSGNNVSDNAVDGNAAGISIGFHSNSSSNKIQDNIVSGNLFYGMAAGTMALGNEIHDNSAEGNGAFDLIDVNPGCGSNTWRNDTFLTAYQSCDK